MAADKSKKASKSVNVLEDANERKRALDMALAGIEKQFGKGAIIRMGDRNVRDIEVIPTGCLDLDMALGVGGLPRGRGAAGGGGGAEDGRRGRVYRCGARA